MRKALEIVAHWPGPHRLGPHLVPPALAREHGHEAGERPSDALLGDLALTIHGRSPTRPAPAASAAWWAPDLHVHGVAGLRVADASVMPNVLSGNINAACIMIGEKAAETIAKDHGVQLERFVG